MKVLCFNFQKRRNEVSQQADCANSTERFDEILRFDNETCLKPLPPRFHEEIHLKALLSDAKLARNILMETFFIL